MDAEVLRRLQIIGVTKIEDWMSEKSINLHDIPYFYKLYSKCSYIENIKINPQKIIGTTHPDYGNKNWFNVLWSLKRFDLNFRNNIECVSDYRSTGVIECEGIDGLFINNGNHRLTVAKFLNMSEFLVATYNYYTKNKENEKIIAILNKYNHEVLDCNYNEFYIFINNKKIYCCFDDILRFDNIYNSINISLKNNLWIYWFDFYIKKTIHNESIFYFKQIAHSKIIKYNIIKHKKNSFRFCILFLV